jgi:AIR synthase related protein, C-terminal domain
MSENERSIYTKYMIQGFRDACIIAETSITGGQTVINPWPIIGGVATSVVPNDTYFIYPDRAQHGDVVILTKPLGTQVAVNVHQWKNKYLRAQQQNIHDDNKEEHKQQKHIDKLDENNNEQEQYWIQCIEQNIITEHDAESMMHTAVCCMVQLNRIASKLLHKYNAHACTDVTGFGLVGHAQNLMENQRSCTTSSQTTTTSTSVTKAATTAVARRKSNKEHDNEDIYIDGNDNTKKRYNSDDTDVATAATIDSTDDSMLHIQFHTFPSIHKTVAVNNSILNFRLLEGYSAETSGGLLICMSPDAAPLFIEELTTELIKDYTNNYTTSSTNSSSVKSSKECSILLPPPPSVGQAAAWIVGDVISVVTPSAKNQTDTKVSRVSISDDLKIIEVEYP